MKVKKASKFITITIIILLSLSLFACKPSANYSFDYDKDAALSKAKQAADCLNTGNYKALYNLMDKELQKDMDVNNMSSNFTNFIKINEQAGKFIKYNEDEEITGLIKNETKYIEVKFTAQCEKIKTTYEIFLDTDMNIEAIKYGTVVEKVYMTQQNGACTGRLELFGLQVPDFNNEAAIQKAKEAADLLNKGDYTQLHKLLSKDFQSISSADDLNTAFSQINTKAGAFINYNDNEQINEFRKSGEKYLSIVFTSQCKNNEMVYEVIFDTDLKIVSLSYGIIYVENGTKKANATSISFKGIKYKFK